MPVSRRTRCAPRPAPDRSSRPGLPARRRRRCCEDMERLPCLATGTPHAATTKETAVEILSVPSPSPPVPHRSIALGGAAIRLHRGAHGRHRADEFRPPSACARRSAVRKATISSSRERARHRWRRTRAPASSASSGCACRRGRSERNIMPAHARSRGDLRKFSSRAWPFSEAMLSGWNCTPWTGWVLCITPWITPSSLVAVTSSTSGMLSGAMVRE